MSQDRIKHQRTRQGMRKAETRKVIDALAEAFMGVMHGPFGHMPDRNWDRNYTKCRRAAAAALRSYRQSTYNEIRKA